MSLQTCLERLGARNDAVRGWSHIDDRAIGGPGALSGVVVGVKDVIDVAGMPTTHGSPVYADNIAAHDAESVARLRAAGAIILGKTVTAEFATYSPGPTINPRKPGHTPGGSSSGSAAVVADGQADLALGTQTAGSVIRPGSFCGVLAFKPSRGRYPLDGVLETAPNLDTLGVFARDLALIDAADAVLAREQSAPDPHQPLRVGLCRTPAWSLASAEMQQALAGFAATLEQAGRVLCDVELPQPFDALGDAQALIHRREAWRALGAIRNDHASDVSDAFKAMIDEGAGESEADYQAARALQEECRGLMGEVLRDVDLLLAPGAPGAAPAGLDSTGDPIFQRMWTAVGAPCLGFPAAWRDDGLPLGLQVIARPGGDRQLLADAKLIVAHAALKEI